MQGESIRWYASAVDAWLAAIIVSVPAITIGVLAFAVARGEGIAVAVIALAFVVALYGALVVPVRYGIGEEYLTVRFGLVRQLILYQDIRRVEPTRSPLSSPALSLNRLRVDSGGGFFRTVMISPARRDDFLDRLAARTGLERRGDALVPPETASG